MRQPILRTLLVGSALVISACSGSNPANVTRAIDAVNAVDQKNVAELMLASGNPSSTLEGRNWLLEPI